MATMLETEAQFTSQAPEDAALTRVFLRGQKGPGDTSAALVGWATLVRFPFGHDAPTPFQERVGCSPALMNCCLLNLPPPAPEEYVRARTGHDLCPRQRPQSFHTLLLQGFGVLTAFIISGSTPMDSYIAEYESCTASLAKVIVKATVAQAAKEGGCLDVAVHLVTQVRRIESESRPSLTFRESLAAEVRAGLRRLFNNRPLKRAKSDTGSELLELAAGRPTAPNLPPKLAEFLSSKTSGGLVPLPSLIPLGHEIYNASSATPAPKPSERAPSFEADAPDGLATAMMEIKSGLLIAPSVHVRGALGLYAGRSYKKGELVCSGASDSGSWLPAEEKPLRPECTLELTLRHVFFATKDARMHLVGDPRRHPWVVMNSTVGAADIADSVDANIFAEFGGDGKVVMDDAFLAFRAARDILPFEELLWRYAWADAGAPPVPAKVEAALVSSSSTAAPAAPAASSDGVPSVGASVKSSSTAAPAAPAASSDGVPTVGASVKSSSPAAPAAPAASSDGVPTVGASVKFHSLSAKPELNGQVARLISFSEESGRWACRLGDGGETINVKPANFAVLAAADGPEVDGLMDGPEVDGLLESLAAALEEGEELDDNGITKGTVDTAYLCSKATRLSEIEKPAGAVYYLAPDQIWVTYGKKQKKLTPRTLWTCMGGKVVAHQKWTKVPYTLTLKTKVFVEGELVKVEDALGAALKRTYGFVDRDLKVPWAADEDQNPLPMCWSPPEQADVAIAEALLAVPGVEAVFNMSPEFWEGTNTLMPTAVSFRLVKAVAFPREVEIAQLAP